VFEDVLKGLNTELGDLRAKRVRCGELMEKVQDKEKKAKLAVQHDILSHAIDRAAICLSILGYEVSMETSDDLTTVWFGTRQKLPSRLQDSIRHFPVPEGYDPNDPVFQRDPNECDCYRRGVLTCGVPCVWAWPPGAKTGARRGES
jgi:hypothetical protein